jgi:lipoprotein-anchoring transpeptidase ErfK/SrfK
LTAVPAPPLRRVALGAGLLLIAVAACGAERPELADEPRATTTTEEPTTTTTVAEPSGPEVAQAKERSIDVYADEDAESPDRQITSGVDTSVDTIPVVFLVKDRPADSDRLEVYLPVRPNGSSGWVDAADVTVTGVPYRIEVGISAHRLRIFKDDELVLDEPVGVGQADRPTPGGVYYLKELLQPPDPTGPYGTYAYGFSGSSNVLQSFNGGTGVIGIHGTNEPDTVGTDVSSGCIRLQNEAIERMVHEIGLPLGTPVEIQA